MNPTKKRSNRLRNARIGSGLSVQELAHMANVSRVTINNIESGKYLPHLKTAWLLAQALGTTVEYLFMKAHVRSE